MTSEDLIIDLNENLTEVVLKRFLTSIRTFSFFFFRFVLRRLGAELDVGGGSHLDAPSPGQPWKFRSTGHRGLSDQHVVTYS